MSRRLTLVATLFFFGGSVSEASAFGVKHSAQGELVRWHRDRVTWTVDRSVRGVAGASAAIEAAVGAWTERGGAPILAAGPPDATIQPGFDGKNVVYYAADGYGPAGSALAVTLLSFDDRTGEVLDADVVLNGKYHFAPIVNDAHDKHDEPTYDIGRVMAHEMGHALGLSDELADVDALMYPYIPRSRSLATSPRADDLAGLTQLYGGASGHAPAASSGETAASPTGAGCTGAVIARSTPGPLPWAALVAAGLAVTALVVARSRGPRAGRLGAAGGALVAAGALVMVPPVDRGSASSRELERASVDVAPAPLAAPLSGEAIVVGVTTSVVGGVFRSELELETVATESAALPPLLRALAWGGTLGGVRQVVGGDPVPRRGERVAIAFVEDHVVARAMTSIPE
jgi:hypothetical protein